MKKNVLCFLIATLISINSVSVFGAMLFVDKVSVNAPQQIKNGVTFVPIRTISEQVGYSVNYDSNTKTINVGNLFTHKIGDTFVTKTNGQIIDIGETSFVDEGVTYVPLRLFAQALDYDVQYDAESKSIWISTGMLDGLDTSMPEKSPNNIRSYNGKTLTIESERIYADQVNQTAINLKNGSVLELNNATVKKVSGSKDKSESGINSAIIVTDSTIKSNKSVITTNGKNSSAIYGNKSKLELTNNEITTDLDNSSIIEVRNNTEVKIAKANLTTNGSDSFIVDSKNSKIAIDNSKMNTYNSNLFDIENSKVSISNSSANATKGDILNLVGDSTIVFDKVSASTSDGDLVNIAGKADISINNSSIIGNSSAFVINGDSKIVLANSNISANFGNLFDISDSNINIELNKNIVSKSINFINFENTSINTKLLTLNGNSQIVDGNIILSQNTKANVNLINNSNFVGTINADNIASEVILDIDGISSWDMTGHSYVDVINPTSKLYSMINSNGYNVYYNANDSRNSWLDKKQYWLPGGGKLVPLYK